VQGEFYGACGGLRACDWECEFAYCCGPWGLFIIRYPTSATVVGGVDRFTRLRQCAFGEWGVHRVTVGFVSSIAKYLVECPLVGYSWGFREEEDVRGMLV